MTEPAIEVHDVGLAYRISKGRPGTLKEQAIAMLKRQVVYERLWALRNVTFTVEPGQVFALVGPNGAGKSTLVKVLARVLPPTEGRVIVRGAVAPMIELGAGFNHEMTGRENTVLYGTLLGRDSDHMAERADEIAAWADLSEFIDVPLRNYSSGMLARLGFAVATDTRPDVLVVDEVLSVGDESFQHRSSMRIQKMIEEGTSVVLVSHQLDLVTEIADRAMWLDHGSVRSIGEPREVVAEYREATRQSDERRADTTAGAMSHSDPSGNIDTDADDGRAAQEVT